MKVAVIGAAGGIGQALALLLKNGLPAGSDRSPSVFYLVV